MGDYAIQARFDVARPTGDLLSWLNSVEGISGWWSDSVSGAASRQGDRFDVDFPTTDVTFELVVSRCDEQVVRWEVPESPPWWKGTTIGFEIEETDDGSTLLFSHGGFEPGDPTIAVITPAWVRFLDNLVEVAQTGRPNPAVVN